MERKYDVLVVGAGILGIAHAFHALRSGKTVALIEKNHRPQSATVRNFGQIVPSGMNRQWQIYGMRSLQLYLDIQHEKEISVRQQGSIYLASNVEEMTLLEELSQINKDQDYPSVLMTKEACLNRYEGLKPEYVVGGLFFPQEINVNPSVLAIRMIDFLIDKYNLDYYPLHLVTHLDQVNETVTVSCSNGNQLKGSFCIVASGTDFKSLYPELFLESDLVVSKLQMLEIASQPNLRIPGSILTGWTIRRYESFAECPSFAAFKAKEDAGLFHQRYGIHILFKQSTDGSIILGDSHEYAKAGEEEKLGFDLKEEINAFMLAEAKKIFNLQTWQVHRSWAGFYSQCSQSDLYQKNIGDSIYVVTGIGGKGMTGALGFAEQNIQKLLNTQKITI